MAGLDRRQAAIFFMVIVRVGKRGDEYLGAHREGRDIGPSQSSLLASLRERDGSQWPDARDQKNGALTLMST